MAVQYVEATKMDSNFRKLNCMLSLWYGVIAGALQIYLIVQNVWKFVRFAELPWPAEQTPTMELNIFIGLNGFVVLLLPFFITACFLRIGNLANDNEMLGKRLRCTTTEGGVLKEESSFSSKNKTQSCLVSVWTHFGPISSLLHIVCSICLLFPQTMVDGVLIKNGFLPKEDVWKSDLDFLNGDGSESSDDMIIRPIGSDSMTSEFAKRISPLTAKNCVVRLEFVNYAVALFIFSIRYAQVFWRCHKKFAIVLGFHQILNSAHTLVSFSTLIVLYKAHVSGIYAKTTTPFLLDGLMTLLLFGIALTVLFFSSCVLYYLGYVKYMAYLQGRIFHHDKASENSFYGGGWTYFPHSCAVSIALALAAAQSPLVHDAFIIYQLSAQKLLLAFPISSVTYFLLWAILWLGLTLARKWTFDITTTIVQPVHGLETTGLPSEITIDLKENVSTVGPFSPSLVVISEGKAFSIENCDHQKSIMALIPKSHWKKTTPTPTPSCLSYKQNKDHSKIKYMPCRKEVTFDDELVSPRYYSRPQSRLDNTINSTRSPSCQQQHNNNQDFDEGEYAFLSRKCQLQEQAGVKSPLIRESLYSQLPLKGGHLSFANDGRHQVVSSPVSTVDSSSGVSSISSIQTGGGSVSVSCSHFSDVCSESEQMTIEPPKAQYEPARNSNLSRRNSVRSYISSTQQPQHHQNEVPYCQSESQKALLEEVYGKLKTGQVRRCESIYSVGGCRNNNSVVGGDDVKFNRSVYEQNFSPKKIPIPATPTSVSTANGNANSPADRKSCNIKDSKIYGYIDDIMPPIPPPLPLLSCVIRKSLSNSEEIEIV